MTKSELAEEFGWNLNTQLEKYNISQAELAYELRVSKQLISKYINGGCLPSIDKFINIILYIGCDLEDLIDMTEYIEED